MGGQSLASFRRTPSSCGWLWGRCVEVCGHEDGPVNAQSPADAEGQAIAAAVRRALSQKGMSRERLAAAADISVSTLEKCLSGERRFSPKTIAKLEAALKIPLNAQTSAHAPEHLGAYARSQASEFEGDYLTLRPSFETAGAIAAYRTVIEWDAAASALAFREHNRADSSYSQKGFVSLPLQTGLVHLLTNVSGQMRLATLRRTISGEMYGMLSTLHAERGSTLRPASVAFAMIPLRGADAAFGAIGAKHDAYPQYRDYLDRIAAQDFALFLAK